MDRLTERVFAFNGTSCMQVKACCNNTCDETCRKQAIGIGCKDCPIQIAIDKLAEYEELEEHGKLLKLPCAIGDTVYTLNPLPSGKTVIAETTADAFFCALSILEDRFGRTVFYTKEDAEIALQKINKRSDVNA